MHYRQNAVVNVVAILMASLLAGTSAKSLSLFLGHNDIMAENIAKPVEGEEVSTCASNQLAVGIQCQKEFCSHVHLICRDVNPKYVRVENVHFTDYSTYDSEEDHDGAVCTSNHGVISYECHHNVIERECNTIRAHCAKIMPQDGYGILYGDNGDDMDGQCRVINELKPGQKGRANAVHCGKNEYIHKVKCTGEDCKHQEVTCCSVKVTKLSTDGRHEKKGFLHAAKKAMGKAWDFVSNPFRDCIGNECNA